MLNYVIGLILLGLGVNKSFYATNPNVMGDSTVATSIKPPLIDTRAFRLNPQEFVMHSPDLRGGTSGSGSGTFKNKFDTHAFGLAILHMQQKFTGDMEASRAAAQREYGAYIIHFKQELALVKDTRKQNAVVELNTNCQDVKQKRTAKMTDMLSKLTAILTNVTNRAASASASGKDTSAVDTAVATAQTAIADAQSAAALQAGTTCTIAITSETNLKTDVGKTISGLQQNLKSVYDKVIAARKAVSDAIKALALVTGESLESPKPIHTATSSGTQ